MAGNGTDNVRCCICNFPAPVDASKHMTLCHECFKNLPFGHKGRYLTVVEEIAALQGELKCVKCHKPGQKVFHYHTGFVDPEGGIAPCDIVFYHLLN